MVSVVIPALNEADNVGAVIDGLLAQDVDQVIVVDNGSTDGCLLYTSPSPRDS